MEVQEKKISVNMQCHINKLNTAKRLLEMGLSIADVAKGADLDHSIVLKLA